MHVVLFLSYIDRVNRFITVTIPPSNMVTHFSSYYFSLLLIIERIPLLSCNLNPLNRISSIVGQEIEG